MGKRRIEMISSAKTYLYQQFSITDQNDLSDATIQRELWQRIDSGVAIDADAAQLCLRCYVSHQIDQTCRDLSLKFGSRNGFTHLDLLPFVLDDDGRPPRSMLYKTLFSTILQTFSPDKGSLSTWTNRYVKQHPELKRFLLQHGVYLVSDWAILNDTTPQQLQRILATTYGFTATELEQTGVLLESFHAVYREDRLKLRLSGVKQCQPPTPEQLSRMVEEVQTRDQRRLSPEKILAQLSAIALKLRRYRISIQGGSIDSVSFDQPEIQPMVERLQSPPEDEEQSEFLRFYQSQFLDCLDYAIAHVIPTVVESLQRKRTPADQPFLKALHLFHCQGQSMGDIAPQIGLKKQYEVTRLLKLNDLRADIRQRSLLTLRDLVVDKAKLYADVERLQRLDHQVDTILNEQLSGVIEEAEAEAKSPIRNQPLRSLLARRLCHYLDHSSLLKDV